MKIELNERKAKALILYICKQFSKQPHKLGAIKLNKILWLSDFSYYRQTLKSISGMRYIKQEHGHTPDPHIFLTLMEGLEKEGMLGVNLVPSFGYSQRQYEVKNDTLLEALSKEERKAVDATIAFARDMSGREISTFAHLDMSWKDADLGEEIPYNSAFGWHDFNPEWRYWTEWEEPIKPTPEHVAWAEKAYLKSMQGHTALAV